MKPVVNFLALLLCLPLVASAASAGDAAKVRLLAFSRVGDEMEVNVTDPDGRQLSQTPVALPTQQLSRPESVSGKSLVFTAPKDAKKILGKVTLPATGRDFVLIFLPAAKDSPQPYQIDALSLPESDFGSGDYAFVNYCGSTVGCVIAGQRLVVQQGKSAVYKSAASGKKETKNPTIVCYRQKNQTWESTPFLSSRIIVQEGVRNLILILRDPASDEVTFRGITDFVERSS